MSDTLQNLKNAVRVRDELKKMDSTKTYHGAGLNIEIGVGGSDKNPVHLQVGCSTDLNVLMAALLKAAVDCVQYWAKTARREQLDLAKYLEDQGL